MKKAEASDDFVKNVQEVYKVLLDYVRVNKIPPTTAVPAMFGAIQHLIHTLNKEHPDTKDFANLLVENNAAVVVKALKAGVGVPNFEI